MPMIVVSLQIKRTNELWFFRTDILSITGIFMKLTKNLVVIASSLWTRSLIKKCICKRTY